MYTSINNNSIIFLSIFLHAAYIHVSTKYVQDTAVGAVNIARRQVRQAPCSHRAYILVGGDKQLEDQSVVDQSTKKEKYQVAVSDRQRTEMGSCVTG